METSTSEYLKMPSNVLLMVFKIVKSVRPTKEYNAI